MNRHKNRMMQSFSGAAILCAILIVSQWAVASGEMAETSARAQATHQAEQLLKQKKLTQAQKILTRIPGQFPMDPYELQMLGSVYWQRGFYDRAALVYRALLSIKPDEFWYRMDFAYMLSEAGLYEGTALLLEGFLNPAASEPAHLQLLAEALDQTGRNTEADTLLQQAMHARPKDLELTLMAAERLLWKGRASDALPLFEKAVAMAPDNARAHKGLASSLQAPESPRYVRELETARALGSRDFETPYLLGLYSASRDPQTMQLYFSEAIALLDDSSQENAYTLSARGYMHGLMGNGSLSGASYAKAMKLYPDNLDIRCDYADLLVKNDRHSEAEALLEPWENPVAEAGKPRPRQEPPEGGPRAPLWLRPELTPAPFKAKTPEPPSRATWARAASIRAHALAALGRENDAVRVFMQLVDKGPADQERDVQVAYELYHAGRWREANRVLNRILKHLTCRPAASLAYDLRNVIRNKYTNLAGSRMLRIDPLVEMTVSYRAYARHHVHDDFAVTMDLSQNAFRDPENTLGSSFFERKSDAGLLLEYHTRPANNFWIETRRYEQARGTRNALRLGAQQITPGGRSYTLELRNNANWHEPIDAVASNSTFDDASFTYGFPAGPHWYGSVQLGLRRYFMYSHDTRLGAERWASLYAGRAILINRNSPCNPHRTTEFHFSYRRGRVDEDPGAPLRIDLTDRSDHFSIGLSSRFVFGNRTELLAGFSLGHDQARGLKLFNLDAYGFDLSLRSDLTPSATLFLSYLSFSENPSATQAGKYQRAEIGVERYLNP